jgi:hypothetical protein
MNASIRRTLCRFAAASTVSVSAAEDMLARRRRLDRPLRVSGMRRADIDRRDLRIVEHRLVAAVGATIEIGSELLRIGQLAGADGDEFARARLR